MFHLGKVPSSREPYITISEHQVPHRKDFTTAYVPLIQFEGWRCCDTSLYGLDRNGFMPAREFAFSFIYFLLTFRGRTINASTAIIPSKIGTFPAQDGIRLSSSSYALLFVYDLILSLLDLRQEPRTGTPQDFSRCEKCLSLREDMKMPPKPTLCC